MNELKVIADFFNNKVKKFGGEVEALDWGSKRTQEIRFLVLSEIGDLNNKSILDVGCGFGDFYTFLKTNGINVNYTGFDISEEVTKLAKEKYPELDIRLGSIFDCFTGFDYVIASGIHNIKKGDNYTLEFNIIKKMYELCNIGIGTNMISSYIKNIKLHDYIFQYDPGIILAKCKEISDYVILRHDYLPNDFTIFLYKKDLYERKNEKNSDIYR